MPEHIKTIQNISYYTGSHPIIKNIKKENSRPTEFGHKVWQSTFVFLDFLTSYNVDLKSKSVLEVGCGWGLLGVFLAKKFNCKVLCTDLDKSVLPIAQAHANLNSTEISTKVASFSMITDSELKSTEILMGVEVCYSEEAADELLKLIKRASNFNVQQVFITDPGRPDFLERLCEANHQYTKKVHSLPGTVNGKVTYLLHLAKI